MAKQVYLRSLEQSDLQQMHKWHNDARLYETLTSPFHPVSLETVQEWLAKKSRYSTTEVNFAICLTETDEHIGNFYLRDIDYVNGTVFLGAFIGNTQNRGKGYAGQALLEAVAYAFGVLRLHRAYMYVLADNHAAVRHLEKCGFVVEGKMRQHIFKDGQFKDVLVLGMCESDYAEYRRTHPE